MIYCFIPLRSGSKGIPGKNTKPFLGKPLFEWVVGAAVKSLCNIVVVSTDIEPFMYRNSKVVVGKRRGQTCDDEATTNQVLLEWLHGDLPGAPPPVSRNSIIVTLHATSPYTTPDDINSAISLLVSTTYESVVSIAPLTRFLWHRVDNHWTPANYTIGEQPRRQDMEPLYLENGAVYVSRMSSILSTGSRISGNICTHVMDYSFELDTPADWIVGENIMGERVGHSSI